MKHLFRGKRKGTDAWTMGNAFYHRKYGKLYTYIGEGVQNGSINGFEVHEDSVGLWTRRVDKNDTQIFEHDIIRLANGEIAEVIFHNGCFYTRFDGCSYRLGGWSSTSFEVIGNSYEHPELLKKSHVDR